MKNNESTRERMYSYLEKWRATSLDMKAFCKKHELSYYSFKYWKYRQRDELSTISTNFSGCMNKSENGRFLPIQIEAQPLVSDIVINFPNGVQLSCPSNVRLNDLATLIKSF
jgi:hypothetical protein